MNRAESTTRSLFSVFSCRSSSIASCVGIGLIAASLGACKSNDANEKESAPTATQDTTQKATVDNSARGSDNIGSVAVPTKKPPVAQAEMPSDDGKHVGAHKWSVQFGGTNRESARAIKFDNDGNIFVAGLMSGKMSVKGSPELVADGTDALIIKMAADGTPIWARNFGGPGPDMIESIAVDSDGNVIATGTFGEELVIGSNSLAASGSDDAFVAKFDADGKRLWAKRLGGMAEDDAQGIAVDAAGNIFVSASFRASVTLAGERFTSVGVDDAYLIALAADGSFRWVRRLASPGADFGRDVKVDDQGRVVWTVEFSQTATFRDQHGGTETKLESVGNLDIGIVKLDSNGVPQWANSFGGLADEGVFDFAIDQSGDIVMTGTFKETIAFGAQTLRSAGEADAFVAKLAADGVPRWAKSYGTRTEDVGSSIAVDRFGNVYAGGWFRGSVSFDGAALRSNGEKDIYMLKLGRDGNQQWSKNYGGKQVDYVRAIAVSDADEAVFVGTFYLTANFGGKDLVADSTGQKLPTGEIYVTRLSP